MKKTNKITLCAMMSGLATALMLLSYFPYLTYAIPAFAGLFIMVLVIEIDCKWASMAYISSAILVFLLAEPESKLMYICLFGYYPIVKAVTEKIRRPVAEWIIKTFVFNIAVLAIYLLFSKLFDLSLEEFGVLGKYGALIFLLVGNVVFVLYDVAISRIATMYILIIHPKLKKFLK